MTVIALYKHIAPSNQALCNCNDLRIHPDVPITCSSFLSALLITVRVFWQDNHHMSKLHSLISQLCIGLMIHTRTEVPSI